MKKLIALMLVAVMVLGLCACGGGGEEKTDAPKVEGLQIGFAKVNTTPSYSCPMGGYGNSSERMSNGLLDYLFFSVVAATGENGETVLLCGFDSMNLPQGAATTLRTAMSEATGVPVANIFISASHSHSTPDASGKYLEDVTKFAVEAANAAMADRSTATVQVGSTTVEGMNWVRHYIMQDDTYAGPNFGNTNQPYKGHASDADGELQVVRFVRAAEDKKDIVMVNWQAHPTMTGGIYLTDISSDFLGPLRDHVNTTLDVETIYFNGAAGNLTVGSWINGETFTSDHREYGKKMGEYVVEVLGGTMTEVAGTDVKTTNTSVTGNCDHTDDELVPIAKQVQEMFATNGNDRGACSAFSQPYGIEGIYHANGIVARAGRGETEDVPIEACSIGGLGFAVAPYEMTDTNGMQIKDASPFDMTLIVGYANGYYNYIISDAQYNYSNYEFQTRRYTRGIGEEMANAFIGMLEDLHG